MSFTKISRSNVVSISRPKDWPADARAYTEERSLSDEAIRLAGIIYAGRDKAKQLTGYSHSGLIVPCLDFDSGTPTDKRQLKPIPALKNGSRFLTQKGPADVYFAPIFDPELTWPKIGADTSQTVYVGEGSLKALRMAQEGYFCISGNGVSGLGGKRKGFKKGLSRINWKGRRVVLVPDSDWATNPDVRIAMMTLADELRSRGAIVLIKLLEPLPDHAKAGADDVLSVENGPELFRNAPEVDSTDDKFTDWRIRPEIAELNKKFAVVQIGNKMRIAVEPDAPDELITFIERRTFIDLFENRFVHYEKDGDTVRIPLSVLWLQDENRRQYKRVAFIPGKKGPSDTLNLWRGWAVKPKKGNWKLLRQHIKSVIAADDQEHYEWILNWMAYRVQNLREPVEVVLVLYSEEEGTGKGFFLEQFGRIFGVHFVSVTGADEVFGKFNKRMETGLLVFADEAFFAGDPKTMSRLMAFVTARRQAVEHKNIDSYEVKNVRAWAISTNHEHVLQASRTARRWAVFDVSAAKLGDSKYFQAIKRQMNKGGTAAMLYSLLNRECTKPVAPNTKGLKRQKLLSLKPCERFIESILHSGLQYNKKHWNEDAPFSIRRDHLVEECRAFLEREHAQSFEYRSLAMRLGHALRLIFGKEVSEGWEDRKNRTYVLPQLARAKELFRRQWGLSSTSGAVRKKTKRAEK